MNSLRKHVYATPCLWLIAMVSAALADDSEVHSIAIHYRHAEGSNVPAETIMQGPSSQLAIVDYAPVDKTIDRHTAEYGLTDTPESYRQSTERRSLTDLALLSIVACIGFMCAFAIVNASLEPMFSIDD